MLYERKKKWIVAIHGFLGCPQDWSLVHQNWLNQSPDPDEVQWIFLDWMSTPELSPIHVSLQEWGGCFLSWLRRQIPNHPTLSVHILGYSLGGRLALQAYQTQPDFFRSLHLISTHSGWSDSPEDLEFRRRRLKSDTWWAEKFLSSPWEDVLKDWNAQPVFEGTTIRTREETSFSISLDQSSTSPSPRSLLAAALTRWSLGLQEDFLSHVSVLDRLSTTVPSKKIRSPIYWMVGEKDLKFKQWMNDRIRGRIHESFTFEVTKSGHRMLWDRPDFIAQHLMTYVE